MTRNQYGLFLPLFVAFGVIAIIVGWAFLWFSVGHIRGSAAPKGEIAATSMVETTSTPDRIVYMCTGDFGNCMTDVVNKTPKIGRTEIQLMSDITTFAKTINLDSTSTHQ